MLAFKIAFRYIFSKKSTNAINVISRVSMLGMGVGAFALLVVLSVFNGFEGLVLSLYNSFYPDIQIMAAKGKTFEDDEAFRQKIMQLSDVVSLSLTLEENAYFEYAGEAQLGVLKGVDEKFNDIATVKNYIRDGEFLLRDSLHRYAVIGANLAYPMNINVNHSTQPLRITVPRSGTATAFTPEDEFATMPVIPAGIFAIQQEFDSKYVFVSLDFARDLLEDENQISAYEIKINPEASLEKTKEEIQKLVGDDFKVLTRYEQKAETYRVMLIERWVTTAILGFIILIISFNIIGSLSMLVLEKKKDISILRTLGCDKQLIKRIYLLNGIVSSALGALTGLLLGYVVLLLQMKFHFLKLGGSNSSFVINYYPVILRWRDPLIALTIIFTISFLASYFPAKRAGENEMSFK